MWKRASGFTVKTNPSRCIGDLRFLMGDAGGKRVCLCVSGKRGEGMGDVGWGAVAGILRVRNKYS